MKKIEKVYTDTPLIDEIVRQIKGMIYEGIVLKDQEEANNYETVESLRLSDIYYDIMNGKDLYEMYEYTYSDFIKIPYMSKDLAKYYVKNPSAIPDEIKPQLMKSQREKFLAKYEEQNNYYNISFYINSYFILQIDARFVLSFTSRSSLLLQFLRCSQAETTLLSLPA